MVILPYAIAIALGIAARYLLKPKNKAFVKDETSTPLSSRGAFANYLVGRKVISPIHNAIWDTKIKKEKLAGAKGPSASQTTNIYYEGGQQVILLGPGERLFAIWANGKKIFVGPIDRISTPSGSTVDLGKNGSFMIFWGELDGPVDTYSGASNRLDVNSRWPYFMRIVWIELRLGTSRNWPALKYDVECRLQYVGLTTSAPWFEDTKSLTGHIFPVVSVTNGNVGTAKVTLAGNKAKYFKNGNYLQLAGNSLIGDFPILYSEHQLTVLPTFPYTVIVDETHIFLGISILGANNSGTVESYSNNKDSGANPVHILWQLLFAPKPYGRALERDIFDLDSFEEAGVIAETERLSSYVHGEDGDTFGALINNLLADMGAVIGFSNGLYRLAMIREVDTGSLPILTIDLVNPPLPQQTNIHEEVAANKLLFIFSDIKKNSRDMTIKIKDDGSASYLDMINIQKVRLETINNKTTASIVGQRRSQEILGASSPITLVANREARDLFPGQAFYAAGISRPLRVVSVKPQARSGKTQLRAYIDYYGAPVTGYDHPDTGQGDADTDEPIADLAFTFIEIPAYLSPGVQTIGFLRIRADPIINFAELWISRDDSSYFQQGQDDDVHTGGQLLEDFAIDTARILEDGPTFTALGPDIATVLDLSSDHVSWRSGRSCMVINGEIFFIRNLVALGSNVYRPQGVLRARFDTVQEHHQVGAPIFLFQNDSVLPVQDIMLEPNVVLYGKTQPSTTELLSLSQVTAVSKLLRGKGVVPMDPLNLRTKDTTNTYKIGQDIVLQWAYRSPLLSNTGAGMQGAGAVTAISPPEGEFILTFKTIGGVTKKTVSGLTLPTYTYLNTQFAQDFGFAPSGEPASIIVELVNSNGGYESNILTKTLIKVS